MVKIMLSCAGGVTTNLLVEKMEREATKSGLKCKIWATGQYGIEEELGNFDVLLVGPQVTKSKVEAMAGGKYAIESIDLYDYSTLNAKNLLNQALTAYNEFYH